MTVDIKMLVKFGLFFKKYDNKAAFLCGNNHSQYHVEVFVLWCFT